MSCGLTVALHQVTGMQQRWSPCSDGVSGTVGKAHGALTESGVLAEVRAPEGRPEVSKIPWRLRPAG